MTAVDVQHSQATAFDLLELPTELLEHVASFLDRKSLLRFRLACPELATRTLRVLARQAFVNRLFLLGDRYSLDALHNISLHPVFSKSLKTIRFSTTYLIASKVDARVRHNLSRPGNNRMTKRAAREEARDARRAYEHFAKDERHLRNGGDAQWVGSALTDFRDRGNIPAIIISDDEDSGEDAVGYARITRMVGYHLCLERIYQDQRPFKVVLANLVMLNYPITHLELGQAATTVPLSIFSEYVHVNPQAFRSLITLRLTLAYTRESREVPRGISSRMECITVPSDLESRMEHIFGLIRVLCEAERLETFSLRMQADYCGGIIHRDGPLIAHALATLPFDSYPRPLMHVRDLELADFEVRSDDLLQILNERKSTLRRVRLDHVWPAKPALEHVAERDRMANDVRAVCEPYGIDLHINYLWQ